MVELLDKIRHLEQIGYYVGDSYELFIEDSKFKFRNICDGRIECIEYTLHDNFDDRDYTDEEVKILHECLSSLERYGIEVDIDLD